MAEAASLGATGYVEVTFDVVDGVTCTPILFDEAHEHRAARANSNTP
jgi:hypothetical protein